MLNRTHLKPKRVIDLASMVDIVLLMLTYFLINTTLSKQAAIKIQLPHSSSFNTEQDNKIIIYVTRDNKIILNDVPVTLNQIGTELKKKVADTSNYHITIQGDQQAEYQTIISVMDTLNQLGMTHFNLSTQKSP